MCNCAKYKTCNSIGFSKRSCFSQEVTSTGSSSASVVLLGLGIARAITGRKSLIVLCFILVMSLFSSASAQDARKAPTTEPTGAPWNQVSGPLSDQQVLAGKGISAAVMRLRGEVWFQQGLRSRNDENGPWKHIPRKEDAVVWIKRYVYIGSREGVRLTAFALVDALNGMDHETLVFTLDSNSSQSPDPLFDAMANTASVVGLSKDPNAPLYNMDVTVRLRKMKLSFALEDPNLGCRISINIMRNAHGHPTVISLTEAPKTFVEYAQRSVASRAGKNIQVLIGTWDTPAIQEDPNELPVNITDGGKGLERVATPAGIFCGKWAGEGFYAVGLGLIEYHYVLVLGSHWDDKYSKESVLHRQTLDKVKVWSRNASK